MYPVIQQESSASVLKGLSTATRTGEEKVLTTYQAALTVPPHQHAAARGERPRHFPHFVFSFNSSSSSSPVGLAHERNESIAA